MGDGDLREFKFNDVTYTPGAGTFKTDFGGLNRLSLAGRARPAGRTLRYLRRVDDFPVVPVNDRWESVQLGTGLTYVVQTSTKVIERCILMATDPGDLVLDPTCGSGTTATVAEQWGRRWITIDTSRVALALARARIMGARYPYFLLADSAEGRAKEAVVSGKCLVASDYKPLATNHYSLRQGFVYERVPHITLKSIANNAEIDVIWEKWQEKLEPLLAALNEAMGKDGNGWEEWEIPRELPETIRADSRPFAVQNKKVKTANTREWTRIEELHQQWWKARIARQQEIDKSIAAKAEFEFLYDKPYEDKKKVRVAGPFTVESLSPHRVLTIDEDDELVDGVAEPGSGYNEVLSFAELILENLRVAGVQQAHKEDRITFTSLVPWPGEGRVCAEGRYLEGDVEKRAGIFIGPEFGTVQRADLVEAARECADADFNVLIACAFNYEAHTTEFNKLGRIPVLKARMNADLHMAKDLKNTGKGNLFVIFGEPDVEVVSGLWLVTRSGRMVACYDKVAELSGLGSLEEINRLGGADLSRFKAVSAGREIWPDQSAETRGSISSVEHRRGSGSKRDGGVSSVSKRGERIIGGSGDSADRRQPAAIPGSASAGPATAPNRRDQQDAWRSKTLAAIETLTGSDFPLTLTTNHYSQVTIHGVDIFKPQTGEVESSNADGIACWFIDTDYNEESFFVRHAYFLGANDPYKSLKTTLKAEINEDAWQSLHSDTSRPFDKPTSGRIAVKVINHLGDEVMKVFKVMTHLPK